MTDFIRFYENYDEEGRLRRHRTEFAATTYILDKLIASGDRVLDVGAGTAPIIGRTHVIICRLSGATESYR